MSLPTPTPPNIAFLGATGLCTLPTLALSLLADHTCPALARDPSRLFSALLARGVPGPLIVSNLHIVAGDSSDHTAVKELLNFAGEAEGKVVLPDVIIAGLGGKPIFQWSLARPFTMAQKRVCADAARAVVAALDAFAAFAASGTTQNPHSTTPPVFAQIAAIGVAQEYRDWPLLYYPITRWLLDGDINEDKREAHAVALEAAGRGLLRPVSVRPATLVGGAGSGVVAVRVGLDDKPVIGWTVAREDVGTWMFEALVKDGEEERQKYIGRNVNLAY